jgi:hypothetical protein
MDNGTDTDRDAPHVSASDISAYVYCHRQWWYAAQDLPSLSTPAMRRGSEEHEHIQRQVTHARQTARAPRGLGCATALLVAVALVAAILVYPW